MAWTASIPERVPWLEPPRRLRCGISNKPLLDATPKRVIDDT
jgi:hypothetical protein